MRERPYDFVFTDLKMPGMDGVEVVRAVKHLRPDADVAVITGYATIESAVETMKDGAADYVQKPFTEDELVEFTKKCLFRRQDRQHKRLSPTVRVVTTDRPPAHEFGLPGGVFISPGHVWANVTVPGMVRIGLGRLRAQDDRPHRCDRPARQGCVGEKGRAPLRRSTGRARGGLQRADLRRGAGRQRRIDAPAFPERARSQQVAVQVTIPPVLPTVRMDALRTEQALVEVISYAFDAMPSGGTLSIGAHPSNGGGQTPGVVVEVRDTGPGIPLSIQPSVGQPFFSTRPEGTGLGVATARRFVEQGGGRLEITSAPPGGTTVRLWLPVAP